MNHVTEHTELTIARLRVCTKTNKPCDGVLYVSDNTIYLKSKPVIGICQVIQGYDFPLTERETEQTETFQFKYGGNSIDISTNIILGGSPTSFKRTIEIKVESEPIISYQILSGLPGYRIQKGFNVGIYGEHFYVVVMLDDLHPTAKTYLSIKEMGLFHDFYLLRIAN